MPWTGSAPNQIYQRTDGVRTGSAVNVTADNNGVNNTAILSDARENDFAAALNLALKRDGGTQMIADLPMNDNKIAELGQGTTRTDGVRIDQVQDGDLVFATVGGTANAITLTTTPIANPTAGMHLGFFATADNTTATTVNLNGAGAAALQVGGGACVGGEVNNGQFHIVGFDGTQWQLANPFVAGNFQPLDSDLTAIAALAPSNDDILQRKSGAWTNRTMAQLLVDIGAQPLDSDLTAIAALSTTSTGRSLLAAADAAAIATIAGVGTANNPQFATVELGNASDTTLSRSAAGRLAVEGKDALLKGQTDTLTTGYNATEADAGTKTTGTFTPDPASGNFQKAVNGGAHTLAPPGSTCSIVIQYTNNGSAGAITTSGFTKVNGAFTTTNGDDFMCYIVRNNGFSHLNIVALQ